MKKYIISSILIVLAGYIMWSLLQVRTAELTRVLPMAPQEEKHAVSVPAANQVAEMRSAPTVPIVTDTHVYLTFVTPGREYNAPVAEGGEVLYGIMKALSETSDFTFTGKDFSSLGFFVDTINGQKNADGKYWILYVNGVLATEGVSQLLVKSGDRIEWRYEKGK